MPIEINNVEYLFATEVAEIIGITRQTLWRWRRDGSVPSGIRYRGRQVLYTREELEDIRQFSERLEPLESGKNDQMSLFEGAK